MGKKIFIGVDGGGTHTAAIAMSDKGEILGRTIGGQTNLYNSDLETARMNLNKTIDDLLEKYHIEDFECISMGMPFLDYAPEEHFVDKFISGMFPSEKVEMHSDVFMALMGMTLGEPGIMVVSGGTGSIALAVDKNEKVHILGGWGHLFQDEGSAYYIAIQGIIAALKSVEGLGEKTILEDKVLEYFNSETHRELIEIFYNPPISVSEMAGFGKEVIGAAKKGDSVAASIVEKAVKILVEYTHILLEKFRSEDCTIGIFGSVFLENSNISDSFIQQVLAKHPRVKIGFPEFKPEIGAIFYALQKRGYIINQAMLRNIRETMKGAL